MDRLLHPLRRLRRSVCGLRLLSDAARGRVTSLEQRQSYSQRGALRAAPRITTQQGAARRGIASAPSANHHDTTTNNDNITHRPHRGIPHPDMVGSTEYLCISEYLEAATNFNPEYPEPEDLEAPNARCLDILEALNYLKETVESYMRELSIAMQEQ